MNPIAQAIDDERFERHLAYCCTLTVEQKRRALSKLNSSKHRVCADIPFGERFDVLEYPDDVPIIPSSGITLPSLLAFATRKPST